MDVYERAAEIWNEGIVEPAFLAELDQEAMELRTECERTGTSLTLVAGAIFHAADDDPDRWAHKEAVAAWALKQPPPMAWFAASYDRVRE